MRVINALRLVVVLSMCGAFACDDGSTVDGGGGGESAAGDAGGPGAGSGGESTESGGQAAVHGTAGESTGESTAENSAGTGGGPTGGASNGTGGEAPSGGSGDTGGSQSGGAAGAVGGPSSGGQGGTPAQGGEGGESNVQPPDSNPTEPAVAREGSYFGFDEGFNRYYTDPTWEPAETVYVSADGSGSGSSRADPASVPDGLYQAAPGTLVYFLNGSYSGCFELDSSQSGTYNEPIVLYGEREGSGALGATIDCCASDRAACFNFEGADYVAVDGFELVGGNYGVRAVGLDLASNGHQRGVAVLNCVGHAQDRDPFFTGQSDWFVIERCVGYDSGEGDGHGIYLSNGSDWNIARYNETFNTVSSDFQINADPFTGCSDAGIDFDDPECDAVAGSSTTGGRGASDFMLVEGNYFHDSLAQGPNFTSVRNSAVSNNIFARPARHGVSFWQETDNPLLGSSGNLVAHNLFVTVTNYDHALSFTNSSTNNRILNNVLVAVTIEGNSAAANSEGTLLITDSTTVDANTFAKNAWISGMFESDDGASPYGPGDDELRLTDFDPAWFADFPMSLQHDPLAYQLEASAPWLDFGDLLSDVPTDREGTVRSAPVDLGPFED